MQNYFFETVHPDLLKVFRFICPGKTADSVAKWKRGKKTCTISLKVLVKETTVKFQSCSFFIGCTYF